MWVSYDNDTYIVPAVKMALDRTCRYCGSVMEHYYNDDFRCTNRRCSNPECVSYVAARANVMVEILEIKGYGFKTLLSMAKSNHILKHWHLIPMIINEKPSVSLVNFLRILNFDSVDSAWEKELVTYDINDVESLLTKYNGRFEKLIKDHEADIRNAEEYFCIQKPETARNDAVENREVINIMITGVPNGYSSKDAFISYLNQRFGKYFIFTHQKTKRQSGVFCLIREPGSTTRGKVEAAMKGGIPICTSQEIINAFANSCET